MQIKKYLFFLVLLITLIFAGCSPKMEPNKNDYFYIHYSQHNADDGVMELNGNKIFWAGEPLFDLDGKIPDKYYTEFNSDPRILMNTELPQELADKIWRIIKSTNLSEMTSYITPSSDQWPRAMYIYQPAGGKPNKAYVVIDKTMTNVDKNYPYVLDALVLHNVMYILQNNLLEHPETENIKKASKHDIWDFSEEDNDKKENIGRGKN